MENGLYTEILTVSGLRIGLAGPLLVRQLLALAVAVEANQIVRRRRLDAALLGHLRQHFAIGPAIVPAHDRAQRGIGLHRRGVDADPLALDQALLGHELQHPAEHRLVDLMRKPAARLRQPRVIGNLLPVLQPQKIAQRMRIRTAPGDAPLAGDPLEIADHVHAEVTSRRHRRRAHLRRVIRLACRLDKAVKTARDQHFLKPVVKHMARRARHLRPGHHRGDMDRSAAGRPTEDGLVLYRFANINGLGGKETMKPGLSTNSISSPPWGAKS